MKAIRVYDTGGPEVMELEEVETPSPRPGEVLVRVEAAGVNFIDIYYRTGQYKHPLPIPLGLEGAGVVEAVGENVRDLKPGDRVIVNGLQRVRPGMAVDTEVAAVVVSTPAASASAPASNALSNRRAVPFGEALDEALLQPPIPPYPLVA